MTVGQEFHAFAASLEDEIKLLKDAEKYLYTVNMGATAIGTGLNAPKGYAEKCANDGMIVIAYFEDGVVRGAAELHPPAQSTDCFACRGRRISSRSRRT